MVALGNHLQPTRRLIGRQRHHPGPFLLGKLVELASVCGQANGIQLAGDREVDQPPQGAFIHRLPGVEGNRNDGNDTADGSRAPPSPHFSPGGVTMAPDFFFQRVLATEERSRNYVRGSMCALKGKRQARARPAPCVIASRQKRSNKLLKTNCFS